MCDKKHNWGYIGNLFDIFVALVEVVVLLAFVLSEILPVILNLYPHS